MSAFLKIISFLMLGSLAIIYWQHGTVSPCGILRSKIQQQDKIAAGLPDGLVEWGMKMQYGNLTPGRCIALLASGAGNSHEQQTQHSITPLQEPVENYKSQTFSTAQRQSFYPSQERLREANKDASDAIIECRNQRLSGELRTYVESTNCSNPKFIEAYKHAGYPYMDLIAILTAKRLEVAEKLDAKDITEIQGQLENQKQFSEVVSIEKQRNMQK